MGTHRRGAHVRRWSLVVLLVSAMVLGASVVSLAAHGISWTPVVAQLPSSDTSSSGGVVTTSAHGFWLEGLIVVALFGGAVFVVCKSSRRS